MHSFEDIDNLALSMSGVDRKIWSAMDEQEELLSTDGG